ncbi:MAG: hypothetical protein CH6_1909 [Candidatus Kapaibacterium sp.]|nr:MAG: hypothetical protein CH6_1909 [Candidatus Kapabacteria bacterium]
MKTAVIFGSGRCSTRTRMYYSAFRLGEILAKKGFNIANGGYGGVMEASAKGASVFNVQRIGVIFRNYKSFPNKYINRTIEANSYIERLEKLIELGDVFFVFEGGSGTLLEIVALLTLKERGLNNAPVFCVGRKWRKIVNFIKKISKFEKLDEIERQIKFVEDVNEIETLLSY